MQNLSFIVEAFNGDDERKAFVVRRLVAPNHPAQACCFTTSLDELAEFFGSVFDISVSNDAA